MDEWIDELMEVQICRNRFELNLKIYEFNSRVTHPDRCKSVTLQSWDLNLYIFSLHFKLCINIWELYSYVKQYFYILFCNELEKRVYIVLPLQIYIYLYQSALMHICTLQHICSGKELFLNLENTRNSGLASTIIE